MSRGKLIFLHVAPFQSNKYLNVIKLFDVQLFQVMFGVYNQLEKSRLQGGMCSHFFLKLHFFD